VSRNTREGWGRIRRTGQAASKKYLHNTLTETILHNRRAIEKNERDITGKL